MCHYIHWTEFQFKYIWAATDKQFKSNRFFTDFFCFSWGYPLIFTKKKGGGGRERARKKKKKWKKKWLSQVNSACTIYDIDCDVVVSYTEL